MVERTIPTELNIKTIEDIVAAHLQAMTVLSHHDEVTHIDFGDVDDHGVMKLTVKVKREQEVSVN